MGKGDKVLTKITTLDKKSSIERIPTGSLVLDKIIGGGLPVGKLIRIYGEYAVGKSTLAYCILKEAIDAGAKPLIIDSENSIDPDYITSYGIDPSKVKVFDDPTITIKKATAAILKAHKEFGINFVLIDSISALLTDIDEEVLEKVEKNDKNPIGLFARQLAIALRVIVSYAAQHNITLLTIAQTRNKIDSYMPELYITGGKAYEYYSHLDLKVSLKKDESTNDYKVLKITTTKNKTDIAFKTCFVKIKIKQGIDKVEDVFNYLVEEGFIKQSTAWYEVPGVEKKLRKSQILNVIHNNLDLFIDICRKHLNGGELQIDPKIFKESTSPESEEIDEDDIEL